MRQPWALAVGMIGENDSPANQQPRGEVMRLSEDKIKRAILHPEKEIRDTAIRYFYSATNADPALMPLAIESLEKYGRAKAFTFTHYLNVLPQTEQTIEWVIAELGRKYPGEAVEGYFYFLNLSRLLCHADVRLVARRAAEIVHAPGFDAKERLAFRERLDMCAGTPKRAGRHCTGIANPARTEPPSKNSTWATLCGSLRPWPVCPTTTGGRSWRFCPRKFEIIGATPSHGCNR